MIIAFKTTLGTNFIFLMSLLKAAGTSIRLCGCFDKSPADGSVASARQCEVFFSVFGLFGEKITGCHQTLP